MVQVRPVHLLGKDHRKVEAQGVKAQQKDHSHRKGCIRRMAMMSRGSRSFPGLAGVMDSELERGWTRLTLFCSRPI